MRVALAPAFVLHRRPYRETSLLVEAFAREHGRLGLIARSAARSRSGLRALLQPFVPVLLSWSGRGELATLTAAESWGRPCRLPPARLLSGLYLNELLIALLARQDPHPELYDAYHETLDQLARGDDEQPSLRRFEVTLLARLGYGLQLEREADTGRPIRSDRRYRYLPDRGPLAVTDASGGIIISGGSLLALAAGQLDEPEILREVKMLTRAALAARLDKPLQSRALLSALHRRHRPSDRI